MVEFKNGSLYFELKGVEFFDCGMSIDVDGVLLDLKNGEISHETVDSTTKLKCFFPDRDICWEILLRDNGGEVVIESTIRNASGKNVKLGQVFLFDTAVSGFSQSGDDLVVLPWQNRCHQRIFKVNDPEMPTLANVKVQFNDNVKHIALQTAFLTFQRCNTELEIKRSDSGLEGLRASCDFAGWELMAGESTTTEVFRIIVGDDPYAQLENWADMVSEAIKPDIWEKPPLGYLGWTWTDTVNGADSYEKVVLENLDAINEKLGGLGFDYLWTSMSNFEGSLPGNWLKWNHDCIPSGRERFIKSVLDKGFSPGLWVGPFYFCSMVEDVMEELKDAILIDQNGERMIVCDEWRHGDAGKIPKGERPCLYALDPSHPKTVAFLKNVFTSYREWGVRYYMLDFLEAGAGNMSRFTYKEHFNKKLVAGPEVYTSMMRQIKGCAGKDTYLLSSTGPNVHNAGIIDGVRVGNDFGEGRAISKESFFYPASYVINNCDFWTGPKVALNCQAASYHTHRKLYINDSGNVLSVDKPIPLSHARINATIHAFSGGPTMLGDDIRQISHSRLELIRKTAPRGSEVGRPLDLFTSVSPDIPTMFVRDVKKEWGDYKVMALYNFTSQVQQKSVAFERLGLDASRGYLMWDFWNEEFLGIHSEKYECVIPPESVAVLRIAEDKGGVQLLGTDMHIMMGEMELTDFQYISDEMRCYFSVTRPVGEEGMVYIHVPENMYVKNIDGLHIARDGKTNSLVIGVPLRFDAEILEREILFDWIERPVDMTTENFA